MKIYVAGRTNDLQRVRQMQYLCERANHTITYNWTENVNAQSIAAEHGAPQDDETLRQYAVNDIGGVYKADLIIVMCAPELLGTAIEMGLAIAWNKPIWLCGEPDRDSVFFRLPNYRRFASELEVFDEIVKLDPIRLERFVDPIILAPPGA